MRYSALCCDYDGTLTEGETMSSATVAALARVRASGRKILLITGRILEDLHRVCDCTEWFDRVVAENGAVLYNPTTREERALGKPPPGVFIQTLRERGVHPLALGRVIVAARQPHTSVVLQTIRDLELSLQVVPNREAIMVLPVGVNKGSGLAVALQELSLCPHSTVGVGDAENDLALLDACGLGVAVANAVPLLKDAADFVTDGARGAGVAELIERLLLSEPHPAEPESRSAAPTTSPCA